MRLDNYLYENGYTNSRNKAKELILNKKVLVNNNIITKASFNISNNEECNIKILQASIYVSRAGDKLKAFFLENPVQIKNKQCLDIGSSTGGFVQVLLEYGAKKVVAVDVGTDQLDQSLRIDKRVECNEQTDIRNYKKDGCFDIVTCDVSFVGIEYIIQDIDRLSCRDIIILFKPQFEVGKEVKRNKKGVVKNQSAITLAQKKFEALCHTLKWHLCDKRASKVHGKEGNLEFFYYYTKR